MHAYIGCIYRIYRTYSHISHAYICACMCTWIFLTHRSPKVPFVRQCNGYLLLHIGRSVPVGGCMGWRSLLKQRQTWSYMFFTEGELVLIAWGNSISPCFQRAWVWAGLSPSESLQCSQWQGGRGKKLEWAAEVTTPHTTALKVFFSLLSDSCAYLWGNSAEVTTDRAEKFVRDEGGRPAWHLRLPPRVLFKRQQQMRVLHVRA